MPPSKQLQPLPGDERRWLCCEYFRCQQQTLLPAADSITFFLHLGGFVFCFVLWGEEGGQRLILQLYVPPHFAHSLNFKRPECAKWDGRKREAIRWKEVGVCCSQEARLGCMTAQEHDTALHSRKTADHSKLQGTDSKWGVRRAVSNPQGSSLRFQGTHRLLKRSTLLIQAHIT